MRNDHRVFWLIEGVLAVAAILMILVMFGGNGAPRKVAVIVSDSDSGKWESFISGIRQGVTEEDLDIVITGTEMIRSSAEEEALIRQEILEGASALIVQPAPGEDTEGMLESIGRELPLVLVGSSTGGDESTAAALVRVSPDTYEMGQALAAMILEDYAGNISDKTLGIVGEAPGTAAASGMRQGFLDGIEASGCTVLWELQEAVGSSSFEERIAEREPVDLVAALGTDALEAAGADAENRRLHGAVLYGIAGSVRAVYFLDHDNAAGLIVPGGYDMGYQSIREIAEKLRNARYEMKSQTVSWRAIRKEDIFEEENEEFLFTPQ